MRCCRDCPNRGCGAYHDKCEKYQAEAANNRKTNATRIIESEKDSMRFLYRENKKLMKNGIRKGDKTKKA
ncbi:unknown [Firmicutes bacterium CAG:882]|jgi:hypothetical protein|nr:unknown [Firmicutes bacterium CAG:882]